MDPAIVERNRASRSRLEELGGRLTDEDLMTEIDPPWKAGALFAHLAFWDRFVLERWRLAVERGERTPASVDDGVMDRINDAALPGWLSITGRTAVGQCVEAAAELDRLIERIDDGVAETVMTEGRERLVDRSLHRMDHLATLEEAFPAGRGP
jgi:hypothetical protein